MSNRIAQGREVALRALLADPIWADRYAKRERSRRIRWWATFAVVGLVFLFAVAPSEGVGVGVVAGMLMGGWLAWMFTPKQDRVLVKTFEEMQKARQS